MKPIKTNEYYLIKDEKDGCFIYIKSKTSKEFVSLMKSCVFEIEEDMLLIYYISKMLNAECILEIKIDNNLDKNIIVKESNLYLTEIDHKSPEESFVYPVISSSLFKKLQVFDHLKG